MVRASRGVSLRYAASWRVAEFPLSEDLSLVDTESLQSAKETAAGALTTPTRPWGERGIRVLDKPLRPSVLDAEPVFRW